MQGLGDAMVEMEYRTKRLAAEVAQDRLAQLAAASRPRNERLTGIRRLAVRLDELLLALECLLHAQFSFQPA